MNFEKNNHYAQRAKHLIPGGAHTYSKGDDQFPSNAPKIISHGKGCRLWDVDGNEYVETAMSLGAVVLGHAYEPVLEVVRNELKKGANFIRPSLIEGELAELLVEVIPSAEMVKFAKNGSDAVTAAVKLARAYTGRDLIARCSADPFNAVHDWFIGSTIMNRGVPKAVQNLTLKFNYNDLESCKTLFAQYPGQIAAFLLEPLSMVEPQENFLAELKMICEANGALLIFDEVVSGFRFSLGGAQEKAGVTPHLSAFGKALANGFSVSALVGQREFMRIGGIEHDQERVFLLSTTHGGETHCLAAAIKTIQEIRDKNIIAHFWDVGCQWQKQIQQSSQRLGLEKHVKTIGFGCKPAVVFTEENGEVSHLLRTLYMQEALREGVLTPYMVPSYAHQPDEMKIILHGMDVALGRLKEFIQSGEPEKYLEGPITKPVFRKHN